MKNIAILGLLSLTFIGFSCMNIFHETIHGNGIVKSEQRNITGATNIESDGNFDIVITQGATVSVRVEADSNLLPYIVTANDGSTLVIKTKDKTNLASDNKIKLYVTTDKLEGVKLSGSGNVTGTGIITSGSTLSLKISGEGNITLSTNAPSIESSISGKGDINLSGTTKDSKIDIAGFGNYKSENLIAENVTISIAGRGDARISASSSLKASIAGSGNIYYHGTPAINQSITGSGSIEQLK